MERRLSFDPAFAGPADWAVMYRAHGLQVVPAHMPKPKPMQWKFPAIKQWKQFQEELVPQSLFDRWYASSGLFFRHQNLGMLTGRASGNIFVLDLDTYKDSGAAQWWAAQLALNNYGEVPHAWRARTGGGGQHLFFRAPANWLVPNNTTPLGVDVKGQGGFVMLPPSKHTDGVYAWEPGWSPEEVGLLEEAPQWLLDAIDAVAEAYGGHKPEARTEDGVQIVQTESPSADHNAFGKRVDGREKEMRDIVYHGVMELRRATPRPTAAQVEEYRQATLNRYLCETSTRLTGVDNERGLEMEGRGATLFNAKWEKMLRKWGTPELEQAAARPNPKTEPFDTRLEDAKLAADFDDDGYEVLDVRAIEALADPRWLIEGLIPEEALGFIYGPPGSGKSFIALGQALSLAMSFETWWKRKIHRPGAVIYISAEGHTDLKFRIAAWQAQHGVKATDAPFYLVRQPINFMRVEDIAKLLRTVASVQRRAGVAVTAVYVDTVSRTLPGADENLQKDMTLFIAACDQVRLDFKATVIGVHHTSRQGNLRGSTVFDGAGDFLLQVERDEGGAKSGKVTATKVKAAEDGWSEPFLLSKIALPMGHTSLVAIRASDEDTSAPVESWPDKPTCRLILQAIGQAWNDGQPWSPKVQAKREGNYAPRQIEVGFGVGIKTAENMVTTWLENRVLAYAQKDAKTHRRGLKVIGWID